MIKAIIFDYGDVIQKVDNDIFLNKIVKKSNKSYNYIKDVVFGSKLYRKLDSGVISPTEFFEIIKKQCNLLMSKDEFFKAYSDRIFEKITTSIDLAKRLMKNYKVSLLSNTNKIDSDNVIKKSELFTLFDTITLSFEVKSAKPDKEIFLDALKKLNLRLNECVYIDDIKEYSEAASRIGVHGIHYTSYKNLIKELKKLNIKV